MVDSDILFQWIDVPDDQPALPPVDEDIGGLKDFASLAIPDDHYIGQGYNEPSVGLLLGLDQSHHIPQGADTHDAITVSYEIPHAGRNAFLPTSHFSPLHLSYYANLFPPALSPDSSPISIASSTPWLRTPETDISIANVANLTPVGAPWDIMEAEESCSIHFLDQLGNSLEDVPSQVQDPMPEDIACTPQIISDASLLISTPCERSGSVISFPYSNQTMFIKSPLPSESVSPQTEAAPLGPPYYPSLPPSSPHVSQSLFGVRYPGENPPAHSASPSLSPLSTLSFFSLSPGASPGPSPLINCSSLLPALSSVPLSDSDEEVGVTESVLSTSRTNSANLRGKRSAGTLDEDAPPLKMLRRSKVKNVDEEEWNPVSERVKRPRAVSSLEFTRRAATSVPTRLPDEDSNVETSQELGGHSDATHTSCEICGLGFTRTSDYNRHMENSANHPETRKVWPCPLCDKTLGRKDALLRHVRTLHEGKILNLEGIPGGQLEVEELSVQRVGQRKMPLRRQPKKDTRRYR